MTHFLKDLAAQLSKRQFSKDEEEIFEHVENEILVPTLKWSVIGVIIVFFLARFAVEHIGTVMIILSFYLIIGIFKFRREANQKIQSLNEKLSGKAILFSTDMGRRVKNQFVVILLVCLLFVIYDICSKNGFCGLSEFISHCRIIWEQFQPSARLDCIAVIFSFIASMSVIVMGTLKVSEISNLVVTNEGLFISDSFLSWKELKRSYVEYFFRRALNLVIETCGGSIIKIQLSRFKIEKEKAEEIAEILNRHVEREIDASDP